MNWISLATKPETCQNLNLFTHKVNFSNPPIKLLLIVAALFLIILLLVYQKLTPEQTETTKEKATSNAPSYSRSQKKSANAPTLGPKRPLSEKKHALSNQSDVKIKEDALLRGLRKLTREAPLDALTQVLDMEADANQKKAMALVFNEWAQYDPEAAAQWIMQNLSIPQQLRITAAISLATEWVTNDPGTAMQWSNDYFDQTQDQHPFQRALIIWSKQDLGAVAQHIAGTSYGDTIGYIATTEFVNIYAQQDVEAAMQWVRANTPEEFQSDAQMEIIDELTKKNPNKAAEYVLQEDNLVNIQSNLDTLLLQWTNTDAVAATEWVEQSLNPSQQEMAYGQLAELFRDQQPQIAVKYAQALSNDKFRIDTTSDILGEWRDQNAPAADQWISKNADKLDPAILEKIGYINLAPEDP